MVSHALYRRLAEGSALVLEGHCVNGPPNIYRERVWSQMRPRLLPGMQYRQDVSCKDRQGILLQLHDIRR